MNFKVSGLPVGPFQALFGQPEHTLSAHGAVRRIADKSPGFPCRVSLRDAEVGESLLLINFEHLPVAGPFRSRYAIFVRENAIESRPGTNEIPAVLVSRLLAVRAFDAEGFLRDADVVEGKEVGPVIERYLEDPQVDYLHLHYAKPGCFAARVDRA